MDLIMKGPKARATADWMVMGFVDLLLGGALKNQKSQFIYVEQRWIFTPLSDQPFEFR